MFTGEWDDNRTRRQKKRDKERAKPKQQMMFSQREMAVFGVNPRPRFSLSPHTRLRLLYPDFRTPDEIEADREKAARDRTKAMFEKEQEDTDSD
jgi:hypothetical protein